MAKVLWITSLAEVGEPERRAAEKLLKGGLYTVNLTVAKVAGPYSTVAKAAVEQALRRAGAVAVIFGHDLLLSPRELAEFFNEWGESLLEVPVYWASRGAWGRIHLNKVELHPRLKRVV